MSEPPEEDERIPDPPRLEAIQPMETNEEVFKGSRQPDGDEVRFFHHDNGDD